MKPVAGEKPIALRAGGSLPMLVNSVEVGTPWIERFYPGSKWEHPGERPIALRAGGSLGWTLCP